MTRVPSGRVAAKADSERFDLHIARSMSSLAYGFRDTTAYNRILELVYYNITMPWYYNIRKLALPAALLARPLSRKSPR